MITDEIQRDNEKESKDKTSAPVVNGTNVDTLPRHGKQVNYLFALTF